MQIASLVPVVLLSTFAFAQPAEVGIPYEKFVLGNGLTVLVHEDRKAPIVAVNIWYHVGSKNERLGRTGFAHLFEHLMFGGSEHHRAQYLPAMEAIGATDLNGTTENDRTNYFENVPTSAVDFTLWMESDRMGYMLNAIDKKVLDLQRGVVQNEKRQGENQPYGIADILIPENTYPYGHPYSWSVIGSMEDLNAASLEDVKEWFRTYYGPSNTVLVLAGDIDAKTAKEKAAKYFGNIPPGPPVAHQQAWIAKRAGVHRQVVQDRVPQARVFEVWNIPQFGSADGDYLSLAAAILSHGKSSRLYKRLIYDDQIASNVEADAQLNEIGGQFYVDATAREGVDIGRVEKAIGEELARLLRDGPTAAELERAKTEARANFLRGIERIGGFGGKSDRLARCEVFTGNPDCYAVTQKRLAEATAADIKSAAGRWLADGVYMLEITPFPQLAAAKVGADRSQPPALGTPPDLKLPTLEHATLSNGMKVILAERHETPIVNFWLKVDAGYAADQSAVPGTAKLMSALLTGGVEGKNALQISDELQMLGARLTANSDLDFTNVFVSALKEKLQPTLNLFASVILHPTFPEAEFERQKKLQLAAIPREKAEPFSMGLRVLPGLMYGRDHAYGAPLTGSGTEAGVGKLTRDGMVRFHREWFHPNGATLIVAGDATLAELLPQLERVFGAWKPGPSPSKNIATVGQQPRPVVYLMDRPGALQSVIFAGEVSPPGGNPQRIAIETMNNVLGGTFSSRLNMNLREDKHWSYGVGSILLAARGQQPYLTFAPVQTDKTKESLAEMSKEFHAILSTAPVTAAELERAKSNQILKLPGSRETAEEVGRSIGQQVQLGLPDDYFEKYSSRVRALSTGDIVDAAKTVVRPESMIWVVVGDKAKIEAGIRELNLGEIRYIDGDGNPLP